MQSISGVDTQPHQVARVRRNLRPMQDNMEHRKPSIR
jgi:hypothetical protein